MVLRIHDAFLGDLMQQEPLVRGAGVP
jgi:hypothetical protein